MLLNGDACVPGLLSLPVGATYQVVASAAEWRNSASGRTASARGRFFAVGIIFILGVGISALGVGTGKSFEMGRGTGRSFDVGQASRLTGLTAVKDVGRKARPTVLGRQGKRDIVPPASGG